MEMQNQTNQNLVILIMDEENPKTKQSPPIPETKTLNRLKFSKPKSRFTEINYPPKSESDQYQPFIPQSPDESQSESDSDSESESTGNEDKYEINPNNTYRKRRIRDRNRKIYRRASIEWSLFLIIITCLICSITLKSVKKELLWGLKIWKWCLMVMVLFCGRLVSGWLVSVMVFFIERNFMLREKVLYFVYGLRKTFQNCAWLGLVLVSWMFMFPHLNRENVVLKTVFRGLVAVLIGATIWLIKVLLVKVLSSSFHVATFFDRLKESVIHHYVLDTLSGPPLDEADTEAAASRRRLLTLRIREGPRGGLSGPRKIDMERLKKLSMEKRPSAWSVKRLVRYVMSSGLSTISRTVDDYGRAESEITSEWEARNCAQRVFKNVAGTSKYIEEEDLLRFLKSEEIYSIFPLFEGAVETGRITKSSFRNWVVEAYIERKALAHSLNDTKTAVHQLHRLASAIVIVIIVVVTLLVVGLATRKVIFLITSQLLLVGFMFQNTCKTMFEAIIFVFVMHPFDVGDRCVIDGVQMTVEEMNILTTVFLRYDSEKIYYPNSVLVTKPISNFRRSPVMGDGVDFSIDISTSIEDINALKKAIQTYIEGKPKYWSPKHSVIVNEIENLDKMKMSLCVQHTMNHQNYGEKTERRSELVLELKKIFGNLGMKYHLLPQEVHLTHVHMGKGRTPFLP